MKNPKSKKPKATQNKAKDTETRSVKMTLSIKDRVLITDHLMPKEGDIVTLTIARDILAKIKISQSEIKKSELKVNPDGGLMWKKNLTKKVEFSNAELELLRKRVGELDSLKKITPELLDVCLMIKK